MHTKDKMDKKDKTKETITGPTRQRYQLGTGKIKGQATNLRIKKVCAKD
jgi:hypothetical protein